MKQILIQFLFVLQVLLCLTNGQKRLHSKMKIYNPSCDQIKCPAISEPVCARLKYLAPEMKNKTLYIIMVNKCELQYVHCHKDIIATEMPMKYCETKTAKVKRRTKRSLGQTKLQNEVDWDDYYNRCPKVCPANDVMVCARCIRDGVYRTFMSVCHMRMFACKHPNEDLRLVARQPCLMSAPYLDDLGVPQGRLTGPDSDDRVNRYIWCRNRQQNKKGVSEHPKCKQFAIIKYKQKLSNAAEGSWWSEMENDYGDRVQRGDFGVVSE